MKICFILFLLAFFCQQSTFARHVDGSTSSDVQKNNVKEGDKVVNHILNKTKEDNANTGDTHAHTYDDAEENEYDEENLSEHAYLKANEIESKEVSFTVKNELNEISKLVELNIELLSNITYNAPLLIKSTQESIIQVFLTTANFKTGFEDDALETEEINLIKKTFQSLSSIFKDFAKFAKGNSKISKSGKLPEVQKELVEESFKSYIEIFKETHKNILSLTYELEENGHTLAANQDVVVEILRIASSDIETLDKVRKTIVLPVTMSDTQTVKKTIKKSAIEMSSTRARLRRRRRRQRKRIMKRFRKKRRQQRRRLRKRRQREKRRRKLQRRQRAQRMKMARRRRRQRMHRIKSRRRRHKMRLRRKQIRLRINRRRQRNRRRTISRKRRGQQRMRRRHRKIVQRMKSRLRRQKKNRRRRLRRVIRRRRIRPIKRRRRNRRRRRPLTLSRDTTFLSRLNDDNNTINELEDESFKRSEVQLYSNRRRIRKARRRRLRLRKKLRKLQRKRNKRIKKQNRRRRRNALRRRRIRLRQKKIRQKRRNQALKRRRRMQRQREKNRRRAARRRAMRRRRQRNRMRRQREKQLRLRMRRRNQNRIKRLQRKLRRKNTRSRRRVWRKRSRPFDQIPDEIQIEKEPVGEKVEENKEPQQSQKKIHERKDEKLSELDANDDSEY